MQGSCNFPSIAPYGRTFRVNDRLVIYKECENLSRIFIQQIRYWKTALILACSPFTCYLITQHPACFVHS